MDEAELQEVMRIATDYFRKQASSEEEVQKMLGALAKTVEDQGAKLVHLGNYLFLVLVRGKSLVEIHTMGDEKDARGLITTFEQLAAYLKNVGVKVAYTYSTDKKFLRLAKMINLKVRDYESVVDGKTYYTFMVEL
jgi:hypothetical protein